jgi:hypothetical protein
VSDFVTLAQTFGLPLAMTLSAVLILARVLVVVSRDKDKISESRFQEMKTQYEARLGEYTARLSDLEEDRDWHRDRLYQTLGLAENSASAVDEIVRRVSKQLPPRR